LKKQLNEFQRENEEFQDKVQIYLNSIRNNNENYEGKIENMESEVDFPFKTLSNYFVKARLLKNDNDNLKTINQRYLREINELKFDLRKFEYENELLTFHENNSSNNKTPIKLSNDSNFIPLQDQRKISLSSNFNYFF